MGKSIFQSLSPAPNAQPQTQQMPGAGQFLTPYQRMQQVMSAMQNPAAFLKQRFPDIPDEIMYDPNRIMQYLQQTRGITDQEIQQVMQNGGIPWQP